MSDGYRLIVQYERAIARARGYIGCDERIKSRLSRDVEECQRRMKCAEVRFLPVDCVEVVYQEWC